MIKSLPDLRKGRFSQGRIWPQFPFDGISLGGYTYTTGHNYNLRLLFFHSIGRVFSGITWLQKSLQALKYLAQLNSVIFIFLGQAQLPWQTARSVEGFNKHASTAGLYYRIDNLLSLFSYASSEQVLSLLLSFRWGWFIVSCSQSWIFCIHIQKELSFPFFPCTDLILYRSWLSMM